MVVPAVEGREGVMARQSVLHYQCGHRGSRVARELDVMADAEADDDVQVGVL